MALASLRTPAGSSEPVICETSVVCTPPHYSAGKGPVDEDDEDDEDNENDNNARVSTYTTTSGTLGSRMRLACLS